MLSCNDFLQAITHLDPIIASVQPGDRVVVSIQPADDYHETVAALRDRGVEVDIRQVELGVQNVGAHQGDYLLQQQGVGTLRESEYNNANPVSTFYAYMNTTTPTMETSAVDAVPESDEGILRAVLLEGRAVIDRLQDSVKVRNLHQKLP